MNLDERFKEYKLNAYVPEEEVVIERPKGLPSPGIVAPLVTEGVSAVVSDIEQRPAESLFALGKGAIEGAIGTPGDLISILKGAYYAATTPEGKSKLEEFTRGLESSTGLPTTEDVKAFINELVPQLQTKATAAESVGEIIAPSGVATYLAKGAAKGFKSITNVIKDTSLGKIDTGILKTNPEFKTWFGQSKIADASGNPIILYHGTMKDFSGFKTPNEISSKNMGGAIWLTSDKEFANAYSMKFKEGTITPTKGGQVIPVYVKMNNPYPAYKFNEGVPSGIDDVKKLQAQGYDGVHLKNTKGRSIYLAFNNDQISPALSVPMERKITETEAMKFGKQTKKLLESIKK
jgi:hypothetical protein